MSCPAHLALEEDWAAIERAVARHWSDLKLEAGEHDLARYVHAYPTVEGKTLWHCFRFGFESYRGLPPSVLCVHPLTKELARANYTPWWPQVTGQPYVNLQPTSEPPYFCFPYTLECIRTHGPAGDPHHRWSAETHTVYATLKEMRRILRPTYYRGYFDVSFEEKLRDQLATKPSAFAPW